MIGSWIILHPKYLYKPSDCIESLVQVFNDVIDVHDFDGLPSDCIESLAQVFNDVIDVLGSYREPDG